MALTTNYNATAYAARPRRLGDYAVFATVRGSHGEKSHHMIGAQYKSAQQCGERAVTMHLNEGSRYRNVEIVNLRSGIRVDVKALLEVVI